MIMKISYPGGKKVNAEFDGFIIKTDQPKNFGGDGTAPGPFSIFLSSIGTCAGFYVLRFCQERNIPIDNIKLILKTNKNNKTDMIEKIFININLPTTFPDNYKKAVIKAVNLCAVKKHLEKPPTFEVSVKKQTI